MMLLGKASKYLPVKTGSFLTAQEWLTVAPPYEWAFLNDH